MDQLGRRRTVHAASAAHNALAARRGRSGQHFPRRRNADRLLGRAGGRDLVPRDLHRQRRGELAVGRARPRRDQHCDQRRQRQDLHRRRARQERGRRQQLDQLRLGRAVHSAAAPGARDHRAGRRRQPDHRAVRARRRRGQLSGQAPLPARRGRGGLHRPLGARQQRPRHHVQGRGRRRRGAEADLHAPELEHRADRDPGRRRGRRLRERLARRDPRRPRLVRRQSRLDRQRDRQRRVDRAGATERAERAGRRRARDPDLGRPGRRLDQPLRVPPALRRRRLERLDGDAAQRRGQHLLPRRGVGPTTPNTASRFAP